jgi:dihydroneopterin aldolase
VSPAERREPQDCSVDVELETDLSRPMQSDAVADSLDYARVFEVIQELARAEEHALLERFAGRLEAELRRVLVFEGLVIRIRKLRPPLDGALEYAAVEIRRP